MRYLWGLVLILLVNCGGDSTGPSATGHLVFVLDAQTCQGASNISIDMIVDGVPRGTAAFSAGTQQRVTVVAGGHVASARISNTGLVFGAANVTVPPNGENSYIMTC